MDSLADVLQIALDAADMAVWRLDIDTREIHASPTLYRLLGHESPPQAWSLHAFERHVFPDDLLMFRAALDRAWTDGELQVALRLRGRDGRIGWIAMRGRAMHDGDGRPCSLAGVVQDISASKAGEQYLRERDAEFRSVFDVTSVGMAQADPITGRLVRVNRRLGEMLGHTRDELLGRRFLSLVHPDDREANWHGYQRLLRGETGSYDFEKRLLSKSGDAVWVLMTVNLIRDTSGLPQRTMAVVMDITERQRAERVLLEREEELRVARDELEGRVSERTAELARANAALQREIADRRLAEQHARELLGRTVQAVEDERGRISRDLHDTLGQHLTALTLGLKRIGELSAGGDGIHEQIARVTEAAQRIDADIDRMSYELRPVALDDLGLDEALRSHAMAWSADSEVPIEVHTHGLRTGRLPAMVETAVYRVVQEALTNVRKHARATRVGLIVERRLDEVRVVVEDDGCGFDPAAVATSAGRHLGLRGMSERAALAAGRIEIESAPGEGTTIYLVVPVAPDDEREQEADEREERL